MTVAYAYFRYILDRENHRSIVYYCPGPSDVPLIVAEPARLWDEMENKRPENDALESSSAKNGETPRLEKNGKDFRFKISSLKTMPSKSCGAVCLRIYYGVLSCLAAIIATGLIIVALLSSIATKAYDTEQSSRMVGMVILAVTAAVTISVSVYALVAVIKNHSKPLHMAGVVLLVVIIIQAVIAAISINITKTDEVNLSKSLEDSFKLAKEAHPRHVKLWALTQSDLNCCGISGPEDYRHKSVPSFFPPNVPISCCSTFDMGRSELVQEKDRQFCKARRAYYDIGCKTLVINAFKDTAAIVLTVTVPLIIIEVLMVLSGCCVAKGKKMKRENEEDGINN